MKRRQDLVNVVHVTVLTVVLAMQACQAATTSFERVGGQGMVDFILVDKQLGRNPQQLITASKDFARRNRKDWCKLLIWDNRAKIPQRLPMTDAQLSAQIAAYDKNPATGLDRLRMLKNGDVIAEY